MVAEFDIYSHDHSYLDGMRTSICILALCAGDHSHVRWPEGIKRGRISVG